ncbi:MAG: hypothetical protein ACLRTD_25010 [Bacteroides sp.]
MTWISHIAAPFVWLLSGAISYPCWELRIEPVTEDEVKPSYRKEQKGAVQEVEQDIVERVFNWATGIYRRL